MASLLAAWPDLLEAGIAVMMLVVLILVRRMRRAMDVPMRGVERRLEQVREQAEVVSTRLAEAERVATPASPLMGLISRRLGAIEAVSLSVAQDLRLASAQPDASVLLGAADRAARRAQWVAELAAGGSAREQQTLIPAIWPRVPALLGSALQGITLRTAFAERLPSVSGGGETWVQILAALVENAAAASPGGIVTAGAAPGASGRVRVWIEDRGCGMSGDVVSRALQPHDLSPGDISRRGLGLPLVAALVEGLDGSLTIASKVGEGTHVELDVPAMRAAPRPSAARFSGTVLLADDDQEVRSATRRMLERFGLEVVEADTGSSAKAQLARQPERFRAAILDVVMPGAPVDTVVTVARERRPELPVMLISGFSTEPMVDGILALGGVRFVAKPFTAGQISQALQDLLGAAAEAGT